MTKTCPTEKTLLLRIRSHKTKIWNILHDWLMRLPLVSPMVLWDLAGSTSWKSLVLLTLEVFGWDIVWKASCLIYCNKSMYNRFRVISHLTELPLCMGVCAGRNEHRKMWQASISKRSHANSFAQVYKLCLDHPSDRLTLTLVVEANRTGFTLSWPA